MDATSQATSLRRLLSDPMLAEVIGRYADASDGAATRERYQRFVSRLDARRFVVPIAGVQGSGKSTFLNAIAFDEPILPIDADETTAVPVEITWAATPDHLATVHYRSGRAETVPATEEALSRFVHNDHNPGNELQVDRIVLQSSSPVLRTGLVLVDLPGTGSLTEANVETTRQYLLDAVGVVFLLRTVPPMTRSDGLFVAANWARLPMAFFVMNRWTDEREEEARDGLDYTIDRLQQVATEHHIKLDGRPCVDVVVGYRALEGRLKRDDALVLKSGLPVFVERIGKAASEWPALVADTIRDAFRGDLEAALGALELQHHAASSDRAAAEARLGEEAERFKAYFAKLESVVAEGERDCSAFQETIEGKLDAWARDARGRLRNNMRTKMRGGIVDGARLDEALRDEEGAEADTIYEEVQELTLAFEDRMKERFRDFPSWKSQRTTHSARVGRTERTKYENALPFIAGSAAGAAAAWGGGVAGAKIGAAIGAGGGPPGAIAGAIIGGIVGLFLGGWLGSKTKQAVTNVRASDAEPSVFSAIDGFIEHTKGELGTSTGKVSVEVGRMLRGWRDQQRADYEAERSQILSSIGATQAQRDATVRALNAERERLHAAVAELAGGRP